MKLELFYFRKALWETRKGFRYLVNRFGLLKQIVHSRRPLDRKANREDFSLHLLTSHRDLLAACWALASFYRVAELLGELFLHDDGSLTKNDRVLIQKLFPNAKIVDSRNFIRDYQAVLDKYPVLKKFRSRYPEYFSFKKIIDPFFVSDKTWHLILDSDVLWFGRPRELEEQIKTNGAQSFMQYNNAVISAVFRDGTTTPEHLSHFNAGMILYSRNNFSLQGLSDFFDRLDVSQKQNLHFADQLGHAYALRNLSALPEERYTIKRSVAGTEIVARHYTGPRRHLFYLEGLEILKSKVLS